MTTRPLTLYRAFIALGAGILLAPISLVKSSLAQSDQPVTSFSSMIGQWTSIEVGQDVAFRIDGTGRVYSFAGSLSGRLKVGNGVGGSNYAISTSNGTCFYIVRFYENGNKAIWNVVDKMSRDGKDLECPIGNFVREDSVASNFSDTQIRTLHLVHDRTSINHTYGYQVFEYDHPIYGYADVGSERKVVYFSACSTSKSDCNANRAEDIFCALQNLQSAYPPETKVIDSSDFAQSWYWDVFNGKSIRQADNARGLWYLSTAYCRLK